MRAGIGVERLSARTGSGSHSPMKNYRPAFESIILNRSAEGLDAKMVESLGTIIRDAFSQAEGKGAGGKVREVFHDLATRIDNDIVKLASQRIRDVVAGVPGEHLHDFLSEMHSEMLKNPDRADAIPEAMLRTYQMTGGRVSAAGIAMAVRAGFAKSKTLCPKEVSQEVRREYESGSLDYIHEIAQARAAQSDSPSQWAYAAVPAQSAANDVRLEIPQGMPDTAGQALPEAIPIVHFIKTSKPDDSLSLDRISQAVPEIVATYQREKARRTKEETRRPDIPQVAIVSAPPARGQAILQKPSIRANRAGEEKRADERPERSAEAGTKRKETAGERETGRPAPEAKKPDIEARQKPGATGYNRHDARPEKKAEAGRAARKRVKLETGPRDIRAAEKRRKAEPAKREKKRKAAMQFERAPVRKNSKKPRDALARFKPRSERIRKGKGEAPLRPRVTNKAERRQDPQKRRRANVQELRPGKRQDVHRRQMPGRGGREGKRPEAAIRGTGRTARRPRAKTIELRAREKRWKCSMTVRQAQAGPHPGRKAAKALRSAAPVRRKRPVIGDIIFKLGIQSRPWPSVRRSR